MIDMRKIVVIFVIAVLFSVFVFSAIEAVYPEPKYEDYCDSYNAKPYPTTRQNDLDCQQLKVTDAEHDACEEKNGRIEYEYDTNGCAISYECEMCYSELNAAQEQYRLYLFIISAIMGLIAISAALFMPLNNNINEWISTGFMLGGLFTLFFGTAMYFGDMGRFVKPVIMLAELIIVIFLAYKKLNDSEKEMHADKNKEKHSSKKK
jgi:hypothetical protein